jgi:hypothetical protein
VRFRGAPRDPWPATASLGAAEGVSISRVIALFVAVILAFLFVPVGALANALPKVFIADPVNNDHVAHVDAAGNLQVAGSLNVANTPTVKAQQDGPWNVGIAGTPTVDVIGGTVTAAPPVATTSRHVSFTIAAGGKDAQDVDPIRVSLITVVGGGDDDVTDEFESCCGSPVNTDFQIGDQDENLGPFVAIPLSQPGEVSSVIVRCYNESEDCELSVDLLGT